MALHIRDARAEQAVRKLARLRKSSLTDAVRTAVEDALKHERQKVPVEELLADLHARIRALPDTGVKLDKKFYDDLWGESELQGEKE